MIAHAITACPLHVAARLDFLSPAPGYAEDSSISVEHFTIIERRSMRMAEVDNSLRDQQVILRIMRKPNSVIVLLFIKNVSTYLSSLPRRRLSPNLWPCRYCSKSR